MSAIFRPSEISDHATKHIHNTHIPLQQQQSSQFCVFFSLSIKLMFSSILLQSFNPQFNVCLLKDFGVHYGVSICTRTVSAFLVSSYTSFSFSMLSLLLLRLFLLCFVAKTFCVDIMTLANAHHRHRHLYSECFEYNPVVSKFITNKEQKK